VGLKVPKLRRATFEGQGIGRYRRREAAVAEALVAMYRAGASARRVEDLTAAPGGTRVSPSTVSALNRTIDARTRAWRDRPIGQEHPHVYLDGVWLNREFGGAVRPVAVLVASGVTADGFREILGVMEGVKEDAASWRASRRHLTERGLRGARLVISDKCLGLVEALGEGVPEARRQRRVVHFYRNVPRAVPTGKAREGVALLKAAHAQEGRGAAPAKAEPVAAKLAGRRLAKAAGAVPAGVAETLAYMSFPRGHGTRVRTNNPLERLNREIKRRARVVGAFPDGESALMLVAARLRYVAGTKWGTHRHLSMDELRAAEAEVEPAGA
jgi:transposase-like protein